MGDDSTNLRPPRSRRAGKSSELPYLDVVEGRDSGARHWLAARKAVLGRAREADVRIEDDGVSRAHAKLVIDEEGFVHVVDLGSKNGTFLNDAPVDAAIVRAGDRIRLGPDVVLRFAYAARDEAPAGDGRTIELSPREREIAALVAAGHTNAEIGQRLAISPHTVMTHLSNVFAREAVTSRAELASLVASGRVRELPRGGRR